MTCHDHIKLLLELNEFDGFYIIITQNSVYQVFFLTPSKLECLETRLRASTLRIPNRMARMVSNKHAYCSKPRSQPLHPYMLA